MFLQVITNGVIFFGMAITQFGLSEFSSVETDLDMFVPPFVAPYWIDSDLSEKGSVAYEVIAGTSDRLTQVSNFISRSENVDFSGTWMLIAEWIDVTLFGFGDIVSKMRSL